MGLEFNQAAAERVAKYVLHRLPLPSDTRVGYIFTPLPDGGVQMVIRLLCQDINASGAIQVPGCKLQDRTDLDDVIRMVAGYIHDGLVDLAFRHVFGNDAIHSEQPDSDFTWPET